MAVPNPPKQQAITTPFPVAALPQAVADICREISNSFEVPLELPCTTALGLLAACCQKKAIVRVNATYTEQINLFTLAISDTGDRKSNVFKLLRDAVIAAQDDYFQAHRDDITRSGLEYQMLKRKLEAAKRGYVFDDSESGYTMDDIMELEQAVRDFDLLVPPKLLVDDATSEKLIDVLEEQGGSIAIASPEGGLFSTLKTAAAANPTFDAYLKAYTGDSIEVARISRKGNAIESPKLSLIIACQPKTAAEMISNKTFRDKGLPARFLFAVCRSLVGTRTFDKPEVSAGAVANYNALIHELLNGVFDKSTLPAELTLTADGSAAYIAFSQGVEAKLGENGELRFMRDWCAKCPGMMVRIAGILAVCDEKNQIDCTIIHRASEIAAWFMDNAAMVFGGGGLSPVDDVREFSAETLRRFLDECTVPCKEEHVKTSALFARYAAWAERNGYKETSPQRFVGALKGMLSVQKHAGGNVANGVAFRD
jgi:hypothetical protein